MPKPKTEQSKQHFEVDKKGLAKLLAKRGKEFIVYELLQNAWDENSKTVHVHITRDGPNRMKVVVIDDNPDGFADLRDAYTLFAESKKKANPEQRGRFNLGEKLVVALAEWAEIETTKGTVTFDADGRRFEPLSKRPKGTAFSAVFTVQSDREIEFVVMNAMHVIPPPHIKTTLNGMPLRERVRVAGFEIQLPTEIADAEGYLRPTVRNTLVNLYEPYDDEKASIYEMGIPVVETGDRWHVDVQQKVPLNTDRDNVRPSYLQRLRAGVLNYMAGKLDGEEASAQWVGDALAHDLIKPAAIKATLEARFGPKMVIADPSDPEGTKIAASQGYTVIPPRAFSRDQWSHIKAAEIVLPAGQVTPSPKPYSPDGKPLRFLDPVDYTDSMRATIAFVHRAAGPIVGRPVTVKVASEITWPFSATYGHGDLTLNLGRLGHDWFARPGSEAQIELLLHEFAHEWVSDHLSSEFADTVARCGAKLALAVAANPTILATVQPAVGRTSRIKAR